MVEENKFRLGVIPAAGKGLRFKELGKQYPKAILPIDGVPIIVRNIQWLFDQGCDEVVVVINHHSDKIKEVVEIFGLDVTFKYQNQQNGLSSAIYDGIRHYDATEHLVVLGDLVVRDELDEKVYSESFLSYSVVEDFSRWCMVSGKESVEQIFDKPTERPNTNKALNGIYFFKDVDLKSMLKDQLKQEFEYEHQISYVIDKVKDKFKLIEVDVVDFGTLEDYLENKDLSLSRSFNSMEVTRDFIRKSSKNVSKLYQEVSWYSSLPIDIKVKTPSIYDVELYSNNPGYVMERILSTTARDIWLYLDSSPETWDQLFDTLFDTLDTMQKFVSTESPSFMKKMYQKTRSRIEEIDIPVENNIISKFMHEFEQEIELFETSECLIHGDFCFSNILIDMQTNSMKMIDPRGELFGSKYYDIAKLVHSVIGDYDFIDAELYLSNGNEVALYNDGKEEAKHLFSEKLNERLTGNEIKYVILITASLFLSMIPLHSHNKENQKLFYKKFKYFFCMYQNFNKGVDCEEIDSI